MPFSITFWKKKFCEEIVTAIRNVNTIKQVTFLNFLDDIKSKNLFINYSLFSCFLCFITNPHFLQARTVLVLSMGINSCSQVKASSSGSLKLSFSMRFGLTLLPRLFLLSHFIKSSTMYNYIPLVYYILKPYGKYSVSFRMLSFPTLSVIISISLSP